MVAAARLGVAGAGVGAPAVRSSAVGRAIGGGVDRWRVGQPVSVLQSSSCAISPKSWSYEPTGDEGKLFIPQTL
jgi:hypothetical protein